MVYQDGVKDAIASIDQAGRIVLPKNVRQGLAIKPGDVFKISITGAVITLNRARKKNGLVRKGTALVFSTVGGRLSVEQVNKCNGRNYLALPSNFHAA